jgi:hypothetical protein
MTARSRPLPSRRRTSRRRARRRRRRRSRPRQRRCRRQRPRQRRKRRRGRSSPKAPDASAGSERLKPVADLIKANRKGFRECFDKWSNAHPGVAGKVKLSFYLDPDGNLDQAEAEESGFSAPDVAECIENFASTLKYPKSPSGKFTRFVYPFDFKPAR